MIILRQKECDMSAGSSPPTEWAEVLILIPGISPESKPGAPDQYYSSLLTQLDKLLPENRKFDDSSIIKLNWGMGKDAAPFDDACADEYLAEVERRMADKIMAIIQRQKTQDRPNLLGRILRGIMGQVKAHEILLYGVPDLFYYVSADGERVIRNRIFKEIGENIVRRHKEATDKGISMTLVGHSAGCVIAHDFLYHLFGKSNQQVAKDIKNDQGVAEVVEMREVHQAGGLRLRRLYTFGSPVAALMFRSNSLVRLVMEDALLDPESIGLREADNLTPSTPRWVNFWDVDDLASFPVASFYDNRKGMIEDKCVDRDRGWKRDLFPASHLWYWQSQEVAKYIAETF